MGEGGKLFLKGKRTFLEMSQLCLSEIVVRILGVKRKKRRLDNNNSNNEMFQRFHRWSHKIQNSKIHGFEAFDSLTLSKKLFFDYKLQ